MLRLLSRIFSLAAVSLFASSAMALPVAYDMTGSLMTMVNQVCNPCTVPVTGTVTIDDDALGNVTLLDISLTHAPYQVGSPGLISVVVYRDTINLGFGNSLLGTGTTVGGNALFGPTSIYQSGTTTCTPGFFPCVLAGLPDGVSPLTSPIPVDLGSWAFDLLGNFTSGGIIYTNEPGQATETLTLVGTVPEPGTMLLVAAGVVGLAIRRRSGF